MSESGEAAPPVRMVSLRVEGEILTAPTDLLCRHSPYFEAMFSGHFRERDQDVIDIQIIKAKSMKLILTFMETGALELIDLSPVPDLIAAARYLQLDQLINKVETEFNDKIDLNSWADILEVAKAAELDKVTNNAATYALLSFDLMKNHLDTIKTLSTLHWYLSHSYLANDNELEVFEFGISWMNNHHIYNLDAILLILGCLSIDGILPHEFSVMVENEAVQNNRIARGVVKCMQRVRRDHGKINMYILELHRRSLIDEFTEEVLVELWPLVSDMFQRWSKKKNCIVAYDIAFGEKSEKSSQFLYKCGINRLCRYQMVARKGHWGWSCVVWGARLVVVGGEINRGTGVFWPRLTVLDVLCKAWTEHDVILPVRRHAGVIVHKNTIYMVGGVGRFRVLLKSCTSYDLMERSVTALPDLPEAIQSPAMAIHQEKLFVAGQLAVYVLRNQWETVTVLPARANCLLSAWGRLFYTQTMQQEVYSLDVDTEESVKVCKFSANVVAILKTDNQLQAFTESPDGSAYMEVRPRPGDAIMKPESYMISAPKLRLLPAAGCFALTTRPSKIESDHSNYTVGLMRRLDASRRTTKSGDKTS